MINYVTVPSFNCMNYFRYCMQSDKVKYYLLSIMLHFLYSIPLNSKHLYADNQVIGIYKASLSVLHAL